MLLLTKQRKGLMMARFNDFGYLERKCSAVKSPRHTKCGWRNWWLVKWEKNLGYICIGKTVTTLPKKYVGKRIRIHIEIIDDGDKK